jgi:hypothetical protein
MPFLCLSIFVLQIKIGQLKNEVERLLEIGAKKYPWRYPENADYIVLEDPDGNLFCVVQKDEMKNENCR